MAGSEEEGPMVAGLHGSELDESSWGMGRWTSGTRYDVINSSRSVLKREIEAKATWLNLRKKVAAMGVPAEQCEVTGWGLRQNKEGGKGVLLLPFIAEAEQRCDEESERNLGGNLGSNLNARKAM